MRYSVKLSYRGADFCGWQVQPNAPSVQGTLEKALSTLLRTQISVVGAGRTDTGVNAVGYIAHFDAAESFDTGLMRYKLNAILPDSIAVHDIREVSGNFHARFSATKREYTYFLHRVKDPFVDNFSFFYGYPDVDFESMNRAASLLLGQHDFSCFEKTGGDNKTSICTIYEAAWHKKDEDHWYFVVAADRFLRNMVRAIVGTLLDVGRGKRTPESVHDLIGQGDRCAAGESVPGHALFLTNIEYRD